MPKIKNWSKVSKLRWQNDETNSVITIVKTLQDNSKIWKMYLDTSSTRGGGYGELIRKFDNKNNAKKFATDWMKKNPNP